MLLKARLNLRSIQREFIYVVYVCLCCDSFCNSSSYKYHVVNGKEQIKCSFQLTASGQVFAPIFASISHSCQIRNLIFVTDQIFRIFELHNVVASFATYFSSHSIFLLNWKHSTVNTQHISDSKLSIALAIEIRCIKQCIRPSTFTSFSIDA